MGGKTDFSKSNRKRASELIGEEAAKLLCKAVEPDENRILVDLVISSEFSAGETSGPVKE